MFQIKKLNPIDDAIYEFLTAEHYAVSDDAENPDAILVRSANMHDMTVGTNLCAVARAGAGTNNIPIPAYTEKGIVVFNTPGANANAVKELVLAGLLLSGRKIIDAANWAQSAKGTIADIPKEVEKQKGRFVGPELRNRKLGIIGLGAVGSMVANAAHYGFDLDVSGYDPYISVAAAWGLSRAIKRAPSAEEIYSQSDYITLHAPYMPQTKGMVGAKEFGLMKEGTVLLNFARGELVDKDALMDALNSGKLRCYVTDFPDEYLLGLPNVICIPHLGASTPESETNCAIMAANQLQDYLTNGNIVNSVNFPNCTLPSSADHRIAILHRNITNMVGQITGALAQEKINIENMINKSRDAFAYTLIDIGTPISDSCVNRITSIEGVLKVRVL